MSICRRSACLRLGAGAPRSFTDLAAGALGEVPAFAFGFAIVVLFWLGYARWRAIIEIVSIIASQTCYGVRAAMIYATLPITIGVFTARYDWTGERAGRRD